MKRFALILSAVAMSGILGFAGAESTQTVPDTSAYESLTVTSTTAMDGNFFMDRWGNNNADMAVRSLLHGYNLVTWDREMGAYVMDDAVVTGALVTQDEKGDRTYTLALASDLTFSDGTPITAWDYAFSILLSYSPEMTQLCGKGAGQTYFVGLDDYAAGRTKVISGVRVTATHQLELTVAARYLPFFYELGMLNVVPYPIHVIAPGCSVRDDGAGAYIANGNGTTFSANLLRKTILDEKTGYLSHPSVVSGPYMLTAYDSQNETATFTLNPLYKGNVDGAKLAIKDLTVIHSTGEEAVAQLASGEVGLVNRVVQADMIDALRQQVIEGKAAMSTYARSGYSFINFSCERDTVGEAAVRKAIALCFDKDAFIKDYVGDYGVRVDGSYGIGQWMYRVASKALNAEPDAPAENASAKEKADYQKELEAWEAISLEKIPVYRQDVQKAVKLLEDNGWNLNRSGSPFDSNKDDVRCKRIGNKLVALELSMLYPEENAIVDELEKTLAEPLKQAGVQLRIDRKPFGDVLKQYYRQEERVYDLIYLATNFSDIFDPSVAYDPADAKAGVANRSGIEDKKLYDLTLKMRSTEPGDLLTYCKYWVDFQMRFAEVLPVLPIYSNAYFDFASPNLQNYVAGNGTSWGEAIVGAYLSDVPTQSAEGTVGTDDLVFDN